MQFYMIPSAHAKEQGPGKPTREDYRNGVLQDIQESNEFGVSNLPGDTSKKNEACRKVRVFQNLVTLQLTVR